MPHIHSPQELCLAWTPSLYEIQDSWASAHFLNPLIDSGDMDATEVQRRIEWRERRINSHQRLCQNRLDIATEKLGGVPSEFNNWGLTNDELIQRMVDVNMELAAQECRIDAYRQYLRDFNYDFANRNTDDMFTLEAVAAESDKRAVRTWIAQYGIVSTQDRLNIALPDGMRKQKEPSRAPFGNVRSAFMRLKQRLMGERPYSSYDHITDRTDESSTTISMPDNLVNSTSAIARSLDYARHEFCSTAAPFDAIQAKQSLVNGNCCNNLLGTKPLSSNKKYIHYNNGLALWRIAIDYIREQREACMPPAPSVLCISDDFTPLSQDQWRDQWANKHDIYDSKYNLDSPLLKMPGEMLYQCL